MCASCRFEHVNQQFGESINTCMEFVVRGKNNMHQRNARKVVQFFSKFLFDGLCKLGIPVAKSHSDKSDKCLLQKPANSKDEVFICERSEIEWVRGCATEAKGPKLIHDSAAGLDSPLALLEVAWGALKYAGHNFAGTGDDRRHHNL